MADIAQTLQNEYTRQLEDEEALWDPLSAERMPQGSRAMGPAMLALHPRRRQFVHWYLVCHLDSAEAAVRAGYAPATGGPLLSHCADAILEEQTARTERLRLTADRVVQEIAAIAFSDISDYVDVRDGRMAFRDMSTIPSDKRRAIAEFTQTFTENSERLSFKLHPKMEALKLACKHLGIALDRVVLQGADGGPIKHQHEVILPPKPTTIEEWERQANAAQHAREVLSEDPIEQLTVDDLDLDPEFEEGE